MSERISLVRHRQWVIPKDAHSHNVLRQYGINQTRINIDTFETIVRLRLRPAGVRGRVTSFDTIWKAFLQRVADNWLKIPTVKITNNAKQVRLESKHPALYTKVKETLVKVQQVFERFFERWGSSYEITISEQGSSVRMVITFAHCHRAPVIAISNDADIAPDPMYIDFDGTRIEILRDTSGMAGASHMRILNVQVKCGLEYKTIHTSRYLHNRLNLTESALGTLLQSTITKD